METQSKINFCTQWRSQKGYLANSPGVMRIMENALLSQEVCIPHASVAVEVGTFCGQSTLFLRELLDKHTRRDVELHTIDTFEGSPEHRAPGSAHYIEELAQDKDWLYKQATDGLREHGYLNLGLAAGTPAGEKDRVLIHRKPSVEAAESFADASVNLVYIDGDHNYESVLADIGAFWSKLAINGVMLGDDFTVGWSGVVMAVLDLFAGMVAVDGNCWYVVKTEENAKRYPSSARKPPEQKKSAANEVAVKAAVRKM